MTDADQRSSEERAMAMRNATLWVVLLAMPVVGCGGGAGGSGDPALPINGFDQVVYANSDANGGAKSAIFPIQIQVWGGSPLAGYSWTMTTGTVLPVPNLEIDALTGVVHGTLPNGFADGVYPFSVTVSDGSTTLNLHLSLSVTACDSTPGAFGGATGNECSDPVGAFDSQGTVGSMNDIMALTTIPTGKALGFNFSATGGTLPYRWQLASGTLPGGLSLNASTGVITGSAFSSAAGNTYSFTISATDAAGKPLINPNDPQQPPLSYSMTL